MVVVAEIGVLTSDGISVVVPSVMEWGFSGGNVRGGRSSGGGTLYGDRGYGGGLHLKEYVYIYVYVVVGVSVVAAAAAPRGSRGFGGGGWIFGVGDLSCTRC